MQSSVQKMSCRTQTAKYYSSAQLKFYRVKSHIKLAGWVIKLGRLATTDSNMNE